MHIPDLHCHSTFSTLDGLGSPKAVVERAKELGWSAASLTEHGNLCSVPFFYKACVQNSIKPILGCEMYVNSETEIQTKDNKKNYHLTVLALSKEGYHNLVRWVTEANQRENYYYNPRIDLGKMAEIAPFPLHHNVILSGCLGSELSQMVMHADEKSYLPMALVYIDSVKSLFPNFYIELHNHKIAKFAKNDQLEAYINLLETETLVTSRLQKVAKAAGVGVTVTNDSHYQRSDQRQTHLATKAVHVRYRDDSHYGNSEESEMSKYFSAYAYWASYMRSMEKIADGVELGQQALDNVMEIVNESNIVLDPLDKFKYSIPFSGYSQPIVQIRKIARDRLTALVGEYGHSAKERFEHELESMGDFAHYLLLMSDFIRYARRQGILTSTRGSAANSILCYCLYIHDVDSIKYGLTFERFYNPSRKKLPDIDIDIEKDRYEDFMAYVHESMDRLEGKGQVVQICNYGTFANRSAFRSVAGALGISKEKQDEIANLLPQMIDSGMVEEETDAYEILKQEYPELYELASGVFDEIKSISQHACGWLFGTAERPVSEWVPLLLIASSNTLVSSYNLKALDDFGLVKGDFLRLKTLSVVKKTLEFTGQDSLDLEAIPIDDEDTFAMLREGRTEGIFTLQGKTNRQGCMECEVAQAEDVIASVAIYRPALTRPGYHRVYNKRRIGDEKVVLKSKVAQKVLGPTYGLPIYQEQILDVGYGIGMNHSEVEEFLQAIKLAKGQGRGAKEAFENLRPMFFKYANKSVGKEGAKELWDLISNFEGYGFNKGHATSYGLLAVRSAYLKRHYPREFFAALLDVYPEKAKYVSAAQSEGFKFVPPCVNRSGSGFSVGEGEREIRIGLQRVRGLGPAAVNAIVSGQPFKSLDDIHERIPGRALNKSGIETLADIGALTSIGIKSSISDPVTKDLFQFENLGFCLQKPRAFKGIKPKHVRPRHSDRWDHDGRYKGVDPTENKHSVSKLFWLPPGEKRLTVQTSAWAKVKTALLEVIDENGIPFELMANSDKIWDVKFLEFFNNHLQGCVVCLDGAVRLSFHNDGPMGFRMYNVTGNYEDDPQVWGLEGKKKRPKHYLSAIRELGRLKRASRGS